jgi:5-methylcytosine-specific restriction endonuclease McrA
LLTSLDDFALRAHFDEVQMEAGRRMSEMIEAPNTDSVEKAPERMPTAKTQRSVFERDGWRCRWCTTQIISPSANRHLSSKFPNVYSGGPRNIDYHGLILCAQGSIDHVIPHSLGGTNDLNNLITACWPCQFARGEVDFALLGLSDPRLREPVLDDWDGCNWFHR